MPGGEQAIREPWRMALAHLVDAQLPDELLRDRIPARNLATVRKMLERNLNTPLTSSAGRLFDAVAALAGLRDRISYEGQAAIELEWAATGVAMKPAYPFDLVEVTEGDPGERRLVVDTRPVIAGVAAMRTRVPGRA